MKSTIVFASVASLAAASAVAPRSYPVESQKSCPAPGTTTPEGDYLCNPAHQYPEGQTCVLIDGCYYLRTTATSTAASYPSPSGKTCPAPGTTTPEGDYLCNPAHQYPAGQTCELVDGCYYLHTSTPSSSASNGYPAPSQTSCPAPGSHNEAGQYMCNPAHQYPEGQTCVLENGCYVLQTSEGEDCSTVSPSVPKPTTTSAASNYPAPSETSCPAAGSHNEAGQYMCNPAHQYPEGQTCVLENGCYVLKTSEGEDCSTTTPSGPKPTTTACPAPGSTDSAGRYSCNPAHTYPNGQTCEFIDNCYFLVYPTTSSAPAPQPTTACPAAGSYNDKGDYMCNPAHQYPSGQTCVLVDGCYILTGVGASTTITVPRPTGSSNGTYPVPSAPSASPSASPSDIVPSAAAGIKASAMSVVAGLAAAAYFVL